MIALLNTLGRLLARLSWRRALTVGRALGWFAGSVVRYRRRLTLDTLARCLPEKSEAERRAIADRMYEHLGMTAVECLMLPHRDPHEVRQRVRVHGEQHAAEALSRRKGGLVLMGHIGNFELLGAAMAGRWTKINAVVKPLRNARANAYWQTTRERMGYYPLPSRNSFRECLKRLKQGEVIAMILDQNMKRSEGIFVEFFARRASTTPGLAYLAAASGAPVVPAYLLRRPDGLHDAHILAPLDPPPDRDPETIRQATQTYTRILENIIREHPDQWIWLHKRWRTQPKPPVRA